MRHLKLTIAYDGTDYVGWQVQKNGISVQQRLEEGLVQGHAGINTHHGQRPDRRGRPCQGPGLRIEDRNRRSHFNDLVPRVECGNAI